MRAATDSDPSVRSGLRWLARKRVTLGVVALLVVVFGFELVVLETYGSRTWQYVFLASADPSPGWVLSSFAHRSVEHLLTTAFVVLVYGSLLEARLRPAAYVLFYVAAGYASTAAQLGVYVGDAPGLGTLGASGAALGLVTLFSTTTAAGHLRGVGDLSTVEVLFAGTGVVVVALLLTNDFLPGVQFASGTAPYGHLGGMLAGGSYGLARVRAQHRRGRRS
jgi:membrane associated rhomboid family serine protease